MEALILVVFSFLDYLICFISVAEMDCLKAVRGSEESGEFYKVSEIESSLFNYVPRTYTIYYRRGSRRLTFGVRTRTTGNPLEMGGREYFIWTDRKAGADRERPRCVDERSKKKIRKI